MTLILTLIFYGIATIWQGLYLAGRFSQPALGLRVVSLLAISCHAVLLYHWIDIGVGQNLSFLNLFSLVAWLVALLIFIATITKPVANLTIFIYPIAAVSILLVLIFPSFAVINTVGKPKELVHILLSTVAFSILCIAALQAVLLAIQEKLLRRKPAIGTLQILPPLEVMESLLFEMIFLGFMLLTVVLITSWWWFSAVFFSLFWQKSLLTALAWLVFTALLVGRYLFGWRGQQAVRWTLSGVFVVMIIYFSGNI